MRAQTVVGAVALIAAIAASIAVFYSPHRSQLVPTTTPQAGGLGRLVTEGSGGGVRAEEARELLSTPNWPAISPPVKVVLGAPGAPPPEPIATIPEAGGLSYTGTNVQVPGIDEGDLLKLAPPYAIYVSRGELFLLRLWPAQNMSVIDSVNLSSTAYEALSEAGVNLSEGAVIRVYGAQALVSGERAVVMFDYQAVPPIGLYDCSTKEVRVGAGELNISIDIPVCLPRPGLWGAVAAVFSFGEGGLKLETYHVFTGLRLVESRMSSGIARIFLTPTVPVPLRGEGVDGVDVLEAGPTYVAGTSRLGNTFVTAASLDPSTGDLGIVNVILPITAAMNKVIVYMRGDNAYILAGEYPPVSDWEAAEAIMKCSPNAPEGLRERLEALGPGAGPGEVLGAIKEWVKEMEAGMAPVLNWIRGLTGGEPLEPNWSVTNASIPPDVWESIKEAEEIGKRLRDFGACVISGIGNLSAVETRVVRVEFTGLEGGVMASTTVAGEVLDRFGVEERGDYLFIVTTDRVGIADFTPLPTRVGILPPITADGGYPIYPITYWVAWAAQGIDYVMRAENLSDLFEVVPWGWETRASSLHVLRAGDLEPVASLTGIAPGESVYAARYVGNYLYVVTYRQVDPLFAIDVGDPSDPKVVGWVEMPGYSEYLHPWGSNYLAGVGVSESRGLKVDLYDVSDPENITVVSSVEVGGWSQALYEHHAFQPIDNETFAIPVTGPNGSGVAVFEVTPGNGLTYLGKVVLGEPVRSARINDVLYCFGTDSVAAAALPGLEVVAELSLFGSPEAGGAGVTTAAPAPG